MSKLTDELNQKASKETVTAIASRFQESASEARKVYIADGGSAMAFLDLVMLHSMVYYMSHFVKAEPMAQLAAIEVLDGMLHHNFKIVANGLISGEFANIGGQTNETNL